LKIGDFGCAVYTHTLRNTIVGCLAYISPEQFNNESYDDKIDVWSVGILTYEILTGKAPFESDIIRMGQHSV
jgi:aurora kinase, other